MTRASVTPLLLLAGAALLPGGAAPAVARTGAECVRPGDRVLASSDGAMLLSAASGRRGATYVACDPATGRRHRVGGSRSDLLSTTGAVMHPAASGTWLGWLDVTVDKSDSYGVVATYDLRAGEVVRSNRVLDDGRIRDLAVGPTGRVALRTRTEVLVLDGDVERRVDHAAPGRLSGVRVEADRVVWRHADAEREAPLDVEASTCPIEANAVRASTALALTAYVDLVGDGRPALAACARSGGGWFDLPGRRASLVDGLVAVERGGTVRVIDVAARSAARPPVRRVHGGWALASDGTIVTVTRGRLVAHPPGGGPVDLGRFPGRADGWTVDDQERVVTWWDGPRRRSVPIAPPCVRPGEQVVVESDAVVIVRRSLGPPRSEPPDAYHACVLATGRRTLVSRDLPSEANGPRAFAVTGTTVAFTYVHGTRYDQTHAVAVLDATREGSRRDQDLRSPAVELVAGDAGRAAVLTDLEVFVVDGDGARRVDVGVPGSLSHLAVDGDTVTWTHGGVARSVPGAVPAGCSPPPGLTPTRQSATALAGVMSRRGRDVVVQHAMACRVAGGGWVDLGPGDVELAGDVVAARRWAGRKARAVVLDLATSKRVRGPVPLDPHAVWTVAADGTLVYAPYLRRRISIVRPDGRVSEAHAESITWLAVDEQAGAIVADTDADVSTADPVVIPFPDRGAP